MIDISKVTMEFQKTAFQKKFFTGVLKESFWKTSYDLLEINLSESFLVCWRPRTRKFCHFLRSAIFENIVEQLKTKRLRKWEHFRKISNLIAGIESHLYYPCLA